MAVGGNPGSGGEWGWIDGEYRHLPPQGGGAGCLLSMMLIVMWGIIWLWLGWIFAGLTVLGKLMVHCGMHLAGRNGKPALARFGKLMASYGSRLAGGYRTSDPSPVTWADVPIISVCLWVLSVAVFFLVSANTPVGRTVAELFKSASQPLQFSLLLGYWAAMLTIREYRRQKPPQTPTTKGVDLELLRFGKAAMWPLKLVVLGGTCWLFCTFWLASEHDPAAGFAICILTAVVIWLPLIRLDERMQWPGSTAATWNKRRDAVVVLLALASLAVAGVVYHGGARPSATMSGAPPTRSLISPAPQHPSLTPFLNEWVGFEDATNKDRERELGRHVGAFRRVSSAGGFVDLCQRIGGQCIQVRDWEGRNLTCEGGSSRHDGTRLALCRVPRK
jgi:hypothetical protein